MELVSYILYGLGCFGIGVGFMAFYHARVVTRMRKEGFTTYTVQPPPTEEMLMLRED